MRAIVLLGLCVLAGTAYADVYRWVDADGKVIYSDQKPPANVSARKLAAPPPPADPDAAKRLATQQLELKKAADAEEEKRKKSEQTANVSKQKDEACSQARGQLQALRSGAPAMRYNAKGEQEYLNDPAREQAVQESEQYIAKNCS